MSFFSKKLTKTLLSSLVALASTVPLSSAYAEGQIRIAEQHGIVYLLLHVAQDQKLIEKHGKELGVDIKPEWIKLSGGAAINDALLSDSIDIAGAGVAPLLTIWDKTKGKHNVRGVASLGNFPYKLISTNPDVKTIEDFTEKDRIALPTAGVSVQSRILQLAVAKKWGEENYKKLDNLTVTLPHPEATAAILNEGTEINAHFANPPFQDQELAGNPNAHVILKSYDVLGGPSTATLLYATEKYRANNPKTYQAFINALEEATEYIKANPEGAADTYLRVNNSTIDRDLLLGVIKNPEIEFTLTPQNTFTLADFMHQVGAIKNQPTSAQDYFFDDIHNRSGN